MTDRYRDWIADLIRWGREAEREAEEIADLILEVLRRGVAAPPPDSTGTPLGGPPVDG